MVGGAEGCPGYGTVEGLVQLWGADVLRLNQVGAGRRRNRFAGGLNGGPSRSLELLGRRLMGIGCDV